MTKKQIKEKNRKNRVLVTFNTGTRTFKSAKDYNRAEEKKICKKPIDKIKKIRYNKYRK